MLNDVLLANVCGCRLLRIVLEPDSVVLDLNEPRLGQFQLRCAAATLLGPIDTIRLALRPLWEHVIDWADADSAQHLQLTFANGTELGIAAVAYQLVAVPTGHV